MLLIGYNVGLTKDAIVALAGFHGVLDQIEWHEGLTQTQVNYHLNRAKVHVIWSRKEGVNRAILEGMFAGVPCIIRDGFNYGYRYPYVNDATGCFSAEDELPDTIVRMLARVYRQRAAEMGDGTHVVPVAATKFYAESIGQASLRVRQASDGPVTSRSELERAGSIPVLLGRRGHPTIRPGLRLLRFAIRRH